LRDTTRALLRYYIDELDLKGDVLEIGGHKLANCALPLFEEPRFRYHDLNIAESDIPNTIIGDITSCADVCADESFDVIYSSDVFEHIDRPWLAAEEIERILKPGGVAVVWTLWSWRNHPCPIDYWRFSAECLEFLFDGLTCLEKGYDLSNRRRDEAGRWASGDDSVPVDALGGWREHWAVYCVVGKDVEPPSTPFKTTEHPQARYLRMDTQGTVTSPAMLGAKPKRLVVEKRLDAIEKKLDRLLKQTRRKSIAKRVRGGSRKLWRKLRG